MPQTGTVVWCVVHDTKISYGANHATWPKSVAEKKQLRFRVVTMIDFMVG